MKVSAVFINMKEPWRDMDLTFTPIDYLGFRWKAERRGSDTIVSAAKIEDVLRLAGYIWPQEVAA